MAKKSWELDIGEPTANPGDADVLLADKKVSISEKSCII